MHASKHKFPVAADYIDIVRWIFKKKKTEIIGKKHKSNRNAIPQQIYQMRHLAP